jgi:hypothetical protein
MPLAAVMDVAQAEDCFDPLIVVAMSGLLEEIGDRSTFEQGPVEVEHLVLIAKQGREQISRFRIDAVTAPPVARAHGRDEGCGFRKVWHRPFRKLWHSSREAAPSSVTIS